MCSSPADEPTRVRREATREALIEATAQIMLDEGYAAATSRRVAAQAGVKSALVHYYFPSMDDLFVAVLRDKADALVGSTAGDWAARARCPSTLRRRGGGQRTCSAVRS